ncbi:hypothetical protein WDW37_14910 [Bdellovibrionota bacterium FG-1]
MRKYFAVLMAVSAVGFTAQAADSVEIQQDDQFAPAGEALAADLGNQLETDSVVAAPHGGGGGHSGNPGGGGHPGGGFHPAPGNPGGGYHPAPGNPGGGYHPAPGNPGGGYHPAPGNPGGGYHPAPGNPGGGYHPGYPGHPGNPSWHPGQPGGYNPGHPGWHPGHSGLPGWHPYPGRTDWYPGCFGGWYEGHGWWPHAYPWRPYPYITYPTYYPQWAYECSAQDEFGRIFSDTRVFDPQDLMLDVIYNCEQQSGAQCIALECHNTQY